MWLDEKFVANTSPYAKTLFFYLTTCQANGLTRYLHVTDRQLLFDTNLTKDQLTQAKKELENIKWMFFTTNWAYHAHFAAYVDYFGRDRVMSAKEQELEDIPQVVKEYFNGLITSYKPVLNQKQETLKDKYNYGYTTEQIANDVDSAF